MKQRLRLRSTPALVNEYRRLLTSDWSGGLAYTGEVIALLRRQLTTGQLTFAFHWEQPPNPRRRLTPRGGVTPISAGASDDLREFLERANAMATEPLVEVALPPLPDLVDRTAAQTWLLLTIQSEWDLGGSSDLFRDTQSLLFLSAIHDVLPATRGAARLSEHALLVETMRWHAANVWQDEPAHSVHLQGRLHEYLGHVEAAREELYIAFRLTRTSDHDYLTRAQAYWSLLMESESSDAARRFALQLYREAPDHALQEVGELVAQSFSVIEFQVREK